MNYKKGGGGGGGVNVELFVYFDLNDINVSKFAYERTKLQFMESVKCAEAM